MPNIEQYLQAARVPNSLASQNFGPWTIRREDVKDLVKRKAHGSQGQIEKGEWPTCTVLYKMTPIGGYDGGCVRVDQKWGELIMKDTRTALMRHMQPVMTCHGKVLVTGLGLGCVVRALLINPDVKYIDVIEKDKHIARIVGHEFLGHPHVHIHVADALTFEPNGRRWDCGWHDVWIERHSERDTLGMLHDAILARFHQFVGTQSAWKLE